MRHAPAAALAAALLAGPSGAITYTVDRFDDAVDSAPGDGFCLAAGGGCTLRAAIMEANTTTTADVIVLPVGTFKLTLTSGPDDESHGDLDVTQAVEINGGGMRETVIVAAPAHRVFELSNGSVTIQRVTMRDGVAAGGGGMLVRAPAQLGCGSCLVTHNRSTGDGGGLEVRAGTFVTLQDSIVAANDAAGSGGGVHNASALQLFASQVTRNRSGAAGGGLHGGAASTMSANQSTIDGNLALGDGGGVALVGGAMGIVNSTVSGNRASRGGGVYANGATGSSLTAATVASNTAQLEGGGLWVSSDSALLVGQTLVGDNAAPTAPDCLDPSFENSDNLVEDASGCAGAIASENVTGLDPELAPLSNYGGPTPTHELLSTTSPAWNAVSFCAGSVDQRGHPRPLDGSCEIGATEFYGIVPVSIAVDGAGNGVLEPLETAAAAPRMGNLTDSPVSLSGQLVDFGGPDPAAFTYTLVDPNASYGTIAPGLVASCAANCYALSIAPAGPVPRPLVHWDTAAHEDSSGALEAHWRLHVGESFADVPAGAPFYGEIESLLHREATSGCEAGNFCPDGPLTRRQLALLLERAYWGPFPPPVSTTQVYADVPLADPFAPWVARLAADGVTAGCAADPDDGGPLLAPYCPDGAVRRDQLARFVLRMRNGPGFVPDPCATPPFADVAVADPLCPWVRHAALAGFIGPCAPDPDGAGPLLARYCPANPASRAQAGADLTRAFALRLWSLGL